MKHEILIYDAFTSTPGMGNPAGVVLNAVGFSEKMMQSAAAKLGFNESAFICTSDKANFRIRYFTPGHEVPVCGHATIASVFARLDHGFAGPGTITLETGAGLLEIEISAVDSVLIRMEQCPYIEKPFSGDLGLVAESLGICADEIDTSLPAVYASTGLWTLLVPIKSLDSFKQMVPHNSLFPEILVDEPHASLHPFCLETYRAECMMHGRHFSSPYSGTVEDPVTGTASGAMGAYYRKHVCTDVHRVTIEQGTETGKDGIVITELPADPSAPVYIYGTAVFTGKKMIDL